MDDQLVYIFQANANQAIGFSVSPWKEGLRVDIRHYVRAIENDELIPTKKGVSIPVDLFSELEDAVSQISSVMATEKIVSKLKKSKTEEIWVGVNKYKGHQLVYIRVYAYLGDPKDWYPTQKGVSMRSHLVLELEAGVAALRKNLGEHHGYKRA